MKLLNPRPILVGPCVYSHLCAARRARGTIWMCWILIGQRILFLFLIGQVFIQTIKPLDELMWWCWCTEFSLVGVLCSNFWVVTFVPLAELVWWWFVCAAFWLVGVLCSWFLIGHLCVAGWGGVGARDDDIGPVRAQARQSSVLLLQKSIERIRGNMGEEANVVIFTGSLLWWGHLQHF